MFFYLIYKKKAKINGHKEKNYCKTKGLDFHLKKKGIQVRCRFCVTVLAQKRQETGGQREAAACLSKTQAGGAALWLKCRLRCLKDFCRKMG